MGASNRFSFIQRPVKGSITAATQKNASGVNGEAFYYEVVDGMNNINTLGYTSGQGAGRRVAVIVWDFVQLRWSFVALNSLQLTTEASSLSNDVGQIKDFMAAVGTYAAPAGAQAGGPYSLVDPAGNAVIIPSAFPAESA